MTIKFPDMSLPRPNLDEMKTSIDSIVAAIEAGTNADQVMDAIQTWEKVRRTYDTWHCLISVHYTQDTKNEDYKRENDFGDEISSKVTALNQKVIQALLASSQRSALEDKLGPHAFNLWEMEVTTFKPEIEEALVRENKLRTEYTELQSSAEIEFEGETYNLSGIAKFFEGADRDLRYRAQKARWDWVEAHADQYDRIYDDLVKVRHEMAQKLGFENFIELGYRRMTRTDYNQGNVEVFRKQVKDHIVPLAKKTFEAQAERLGLDSLMVWDTSVYDETGNPKPVGGVAELTELAGQMFNEMNPELGDFYAMMVERQLLDLDTRPGKSGGGYCTTFADYGVPFIFANFTGNKHDAEVFTHEIGHAFQCYLSMDKPLYEYVWPTMEACEIHSMSLEFLTWPHMELFFGDDAERFRKIHLTQSLQFIPYGTAVDHYQHLVYESPNATPAERKAMWKQMEETYLPWTNWGEFSHGAEGGRWQLQSHIYGMPFYYIDYVLALTCALQFWDKMELDYDNALKDYVTLCKRGGEAPFLDLAKSAGLRSPFEEGCLVAVADRAAQAI